MFSTATKPDRFGVYVQKSRKLAEAEAETSDPICSGMARFPPKTRDDDSLNERDLPVNNHNPILRIEWGDHDFQEGLGNHEPCM